MTLLKYGFGLPPKTRVIRIVPIPKKMVPLPVTLGQHLRQARVRRGERQKDAAKALGVAHDTYMCWEKDQKLPFPRYYPRLIEYVGYNMLPVGETLGEKRKRERLTLGFTTDQMAAHLGCDPSTVERREKE